jgi:hypothetical protein
MTTHDLKCWPGYFEALMDGSKTFEVRRDDRKFAVGDELLLREWNPDIEQYSGRQLKRHVTCIMHGMGNVGVIGPCRGISLGFVVLGLSSESLEGRAQHDDGLARGVDRAQP